MRILLTGATGFVGSGLKNAFPEMIAAPSLRTATEEEVRRIVDGFDTVIHTAAISDIGTCEKDPEGSYQANVTLPVYLARACKGRKLICFSSDQVYSGGGEEGPYDEHMAVPANTYARHKLEMDERVLDICPEAVILRAEWMYDYPSMRMNYLRIILEGKDRVAFSSNQYRGITWLREVAEAFSVIPGLPGGVYNFGSEATESMYEITRQFVNYLEKSLMVDDAPPRHNLWMNCEKARKHGIRFSKVEDALKRCVEVYGLKQTETIRW